MRAADPPLQESMEPHALKIMEEHQRKGLRLLSVVGAGAFSIAISAIAERTINPSVPAGTSVALKLSRERVPVDHIKNHSLAREGTNTVLLEKRLARKEFSDIIPAPVSLWDSPRTGRCFWGHTAADEAGFCGIFECVELIDQCFGDAIKPFGDQWIREGVFGEGFQDMVLRASFRLAFELRHMAGLAVMDFKPANVGRRANGRCAIWDLGHSAVYPLPGQRQTNDLPVPMCRNATVAIATDGQTAKAKGRRLLGKRDPSSGLCLVSNQQATVYCRALAEQRRGWGRVAGGTPGYADKALKGEQLEPDKAFAYDMFAVGRTVFKLLTHDRRKQRLADWDDSACRAAMDGPAGIRRMLVDAVDPSARITQGIMVDRLSSLLAGLLNPEPTARMGALQAMLDAANTLPFLSPQHSIALEDGAGIAMAGGGPVESLQAPFRDHPALKGEWLPPVVLQPQAGMGMGAKLGRPLKKGDVAAVYGGEFIPTTDTGGLRRAYPSRYGITVRAVEGIREDGFICDAAQTPNRPFKWFIDNNVAGPFMNGRDGVGFDVNCDLDRHSAWLDGAGGVWFVLRANRAIKAGEWLMWKYNWMSGAGIAIPGLTFSFT